MSVVLAAVAAVAATPTPSPEVITHTVYVTPAWVTQLGIILQQSAALGLLVVPAAIASFAHNFVNPKLGKYGNAALLYGYSIVLGLLGLVATNALSLTTVDFRSPEQVGTAILAVIGAATVVYNRYKATHPDVAVVDVSAVATQL